MVLFSISWQIGCFDHPQTPWKGSFWDVSNESWSFRISGKKLSPEAFSEPIFLSPKIFPQTLRTFPQNFSPSLSPRVEHCSLSSLAGGLSVTYGRNLTEWIFPRNRGLLTLPIWRRRNTFPRKVIYNRWNYQTSKISRKILQRMCVFGKWFTIGIKFGHWKSSPATWFHVFSCSCNLAVTSTTL